MATEVVSTIRSSGGDYTTLSAWEAGEQRNLVTADEIAVAELYNDWPSGLNDNCIISGWTTSSTQFVKVTVAPGHRHNGVPLSGFYFYSTTTWGQFILHDSGDARFEWLDGFFDTHLGGYSFYTPSGTKNGIWYNCISRNRSGAAFTSNSTSTTYYFGCLGYLSTSGFSGPAWANNHYINCVASSCSTGFDKNSSGSGSSVRNCIAYSCSTPYATSTWNAVSDSNAADSGSVPGTNPTTCSSADFVDAANKDFHLVSGSALRAYGGNYYQNTGAYADRAYDVDGDEWPSTGAWDIGYDLYISATESVSNDLADDYAIRAAISADIADSYTLRAYAASDLSDAYFLRSQVAQNLSDAYGIMAQVAQSLADQYAIQAAVSADVQDQYAVRQAIAQELADAYILRAQAQADLADQYGIRAATQASLADAYEIFTASAVASDLTDTYAVRSSTAADLTDGAYIRTAVAASLADSVDIRASVAAVMQDGFAILSRVTTDLSDSAAIMQEVMADLADAFDILDQPGACPSAASIASAILAASQVTPIHADIRKVRGTAIKGSGIPPTFAPDGTMTDPGDPWLPDI